jgi:hypothetical protein
MFTTKHFAIIIKKVLFFMPSLQSFQDKNLTVCKKFFP